MKISKLSVFLLTAALLGSSAVFAGETNKATLKLSQPTTVEGKTLQPGDYKVTWEGSGPTVQVTIQQGKESVVTFQAPVSEQGARNTGDAYGSSSELDGSHALTAIYPGGKRIALELNQGQQSNAAAAK